MDLYTKYLHLHQDSDTVNIRDDDIRFSAADSHRVWVGGRGNCIAGGYLVPYIGAAYEYELSGEFKVSASGAEVAPPSLQGSTGVGNLGV